MFKKFAIIVGFVMLLFVIPLTSEARSYKTKSSDVYVKGYYRSNGTYIKPYYRSAPDSSILNNYSCIDNGRCGTGNYTVPSTPSYTIPSYVAPKPTVPTYTPPTIDWNKPLNSTQPKCVANAYYDGSKCTCSINYRTSPKGDSCITYSDYCIERYDANSHYNSSDSYCYCGIGYTYDKVNDKCVPPTVAVPTKINTVSSAMPNPCPENAAIWNGTCKCLPGFEFTHGATKCSKIR